MDDNISGRLRVGRIIVGALIAGLTIFVVMVGVLRQRIEPAANPEATRLLLLVLLALPVAELPAYLLVRTALLRRLRNSLSDQQATDSLRQSLAEQMLALSLLGSAMLEGFGLYGGVVCMITGEWTALIAPAIAILGLILCLPTEDRFARFESRVTGRPSPDGF